MMGTTPWRPSATPAALERRAMLLAGIRAFMAGRNVLEVDTGVLARAAPSERGLSSFRVEAGGYLQPSPEHAMKRLLAAGAGPIYQLGHVFRAGEVGRWHNPEFCMLEWYRPQDDMAALIEETAALIDAVAGIDAVTTRPYAAVFQQYTDINPLTADTPALAACAARHDVAPETPAECSDRGFWLDLLMSLVIQPKLGHDGPICVTQFPADDAVLVESDAADPRVCRRFEFYWRGVELANGAQELTDAGVARTRMAREMQAGEAAPPLDEALLAAMAAGLPRCAGVALGVDRLLALMLEYDRLADVLAFDWALR